jgi:hypothetical protein
MKSTGAFFLLASAVVGGCSGTLSAPDGGTGSGGSSGTAGTGGTGGVSYDAAAIPPDLRDQLSAAATTWANAKGQCPLYSYDRRWTSVFGGGASTAVEIQNDLATRRRYSTHTADGGLDVGSWMTVWDERSADVGSHGTSWSIFPASTVEQLLAECASLLAHDPAAYTLRLGVDEHGVPTECTYVPVGCVDDCLAGITIASFDCAPLAN